ncbi:S-adenosyl-L-methionine-dependent methyltransferase [Lasiosphaeria miniovina]|uniref:S-adenosyl-L-methionine-dependent methyltransferase n=1 Tax=Lasiosphaeria miniovina TaxID=1954250 RepID=A0AA40ADG5_9PEZI|nr:S-adenosyl-L-methionine-dependent methyltransferase [Lasiosphaeria miniovina]KAK0713762.1 S-adenosyl-L-methionine-dependent methyltransferase [Lasiosphaeria miniovina]
MTGTSSSPPPAATATATAVAAAPEATPAPAAPAAPEATPAPAAAAPPPATVVPSSSTAVPPPVVPSSSTAVPPPENSSNEAAAQIDVDPDFGLDADSALGDGSAINSSTASLSSSILNYREVHGRTYQNFKDAEYWAPNDEAQNDGLDFHHMMYLLHDNKLNLAPVENPQAVLDVGTGTGIWAMDFADQYPSAQVIGTDLSPIQPAWTPPNCKFELDDASQTWTYPDNNFDFIHLRFMLGSIEDYVKLYREALRCLKPGGWLEHTDFTIKLGSEDGSVPADCVYTLWNELFRKAGEKTGRTFLVTDKNQNAGWMREAGFSAAVYTRNFNLPFGTWPKDPRWKEIGAFNLAGCEQGLEGYILYLGTQVLGWSFEELQVLLVDMRKAMRNTSYHASYPW